MGNLGLPEILVIAFLVILLFGARKLPELGKNLGEGIRNFKGAVNDGLKEGERDASKPPTDAKH